jgi:hypothetical protein
MFAVRRGYLVALALTALLAVGFVVVPNIVNRARAAHARAEVNAAIAGLDRLRVPTKLVPMTTSCGEYRCFRIAHQPTPKAAYQLANAMLRSMGALPEPGQRCFGRPSAHGPITLCNDTGNVDSEPIDVSIVPFWPVVHRRIEPRGSEVDVIFVCGIGPRSDNVIIEVTPGNTSNCQY